MLRDYQEEAVTALLRGLRAHRSVLAGLPTGSGKSLVLAACAKALREEGQTVLLAVHSRELVRQDAEACQALGLEPKIWCAGLGRKEDGDLVVGTPRSLLASTVMRERIEAGKFDILLVDEAHRVNLREKNADYTVLFEHTKKQAGVTATAFRGDTRCTLVGPYGYNSFQALVVNFGIEDLVARGWLCPLRDTLDRGASVLTAVDTEDLPEGVDGDFKIPALEKRACQLVKKHVAESLPYLDVAKKALCFGVSVPHARMLAHAFRNAGVAAEDITGNTPAWVRDLRLQAFREGGLKVITNCEILTTGFDCPDVDLLLVMRPTLSRVLYTQILGRGTRKAPGKTFCQVLDFGGNRDRFGGIYPARRQKHAAILVPCLQCGEREVDAGVIWEKSVFQEFLDRHPGLALSVRQERNGAEILAEKLGLFVSAEREDETADDLEFRQKLVKLLSCPPCEGLRFPKGAMAELLARLEKLHLGRTLNEQENRFLVVRDELTGRYGKGVDWQTVRVFHHRATSGVQCVKVVFLNRTGQAVHTEFLALSSRNGGDDRKVHWNAARTLRQNWQLAEARMTMLNLETIDGWLQDQTNLHNGGLLFLQEQPGSTWKKIAVILWRPKSEETGKKDAGDGEKALAAL